MTGKEYRDSALKFLLLPFFLIAWIVGCAYMHIRFGFKVGEHFGVHLHGLCNRPEHNVEVKKDIVPPEIMEKLRKHAERAGGTMCEDPECDIPIPHAHIPDIGRED